MTPVLSTETGKWDFTGENFILCEGESDQNFLESLIKHKSLPPFQVMHANKANGGKGGGIGGFGPAIEGFEAHTGFSKLKGIAIVTDNDKQSSCSDLEKKLREEYGYESSGIDCWGKMGTVFVRLILLPGLTRLAT